MMRLASILLVCVLLSTSVISGTLAKYTTSASAADTARVAKWGITLTGTSDLFSKTYNYDDTNSKSDDENTITGVLSVNSNDKVVAPGTKGSVAAFELTGTPEVSYMLTLDVADGYKSVFLKNDNTTYEPIKFQVKIGTQSIPSEDSTETLNSIEEVVEALEGFKLFYDADSKSYYYKDAQLDVGENTENWTQYNGNNLTITVSWEWPFDGDDTKDTILGNLASNTEYYKDADGNSLYSNSGDSANYSTDISIQITATATQID